MTWRARARPTRRRRSTARRPGDRERGAVSVELVIATPLLLLLVMGVIQFGLWQHAEHVAAAAAQQGVAAARLQGATAAQGQQQAEQVLRQVGTGVLAGPEVTASRDATTTVTVTGRAESIVGIFSLPVKAVAVGPTEPGGAGP